jgi:hypothetical protein
MTLEDEQMHKEQKGNNVGVNLKAVNETHLEGETL